MRQLNRRQRAALLFLVTAAVLLAVTVAGICLEEQATQTDFSAQNLAPGPAHLFGTDWLGRDMLCRTFRSAGVFSLMDYGTTRLSGGLKQLAPAAGLTILKQNKNLLQTSGRYHPGIKVEPRHRG